MCGRYFRRSDKQELAARFRLGKLGDFPLPPDFNAAPTTVQPVIREVRDGHVVDGVPERELVQMRWGLLPHFADKPGDFKPVATMNARSETAATAPLFRTPFQRRRCLVPVDGFYEWRKVDDRGKARKTPFAFTLRTGEPLALAGLWDAWKEPKRGVQTVDTWLQSFTILTTEANDIMAPVHDRMPVILRERDWTAWLRRDFGEQPGDREQLQALLRPFDADAMLAEPCNPAVGNVRNNGPEMLVCPPPDAPGGTENSA